MVAVNTLEAIEVIPTGKALGAEVRGIDFAQPVPEAVAEPRSSEFGPIIWCCCSVG